MTDRELMQQALNVLKIFVDGGNSAWARKIIEIKEALRDRLAQPEQEPVAWIYSHKGQKSVSMNYVAGVRAIPLYTAPSQREWQGLTDEEIAWLWSLAVEAKLENMPRHFARMVEENLRGKNHAI